MNTTTLPAGRALGLETLRTLAALAEEHGLEPPCGIILGTSPRPLFSLQMRSDDRAGVDAWARVLGLPPAIERPLDGFISYESRAESAYGAEPVLLGWQMVDVWAACDRQPSFWRSV